MSFQKFKKKLETYKYVLFSKLNEVIITFFENCTGFLNLSCLLKFLESVCVHTYDDIRYSTH